MTELGVLSRMGINKIGSVWLVDGEVSSGLELGEQCSTRIHNL